MKWSLSLGTIAGTTVRVHLSLVLLLAWFGVGRYIVDGRTAAIEGMAFLVALFVCVLLHEFGHVVAARYYGVATPDITLSPLGGVARLAGMPEAPRAEITIALAGPAVNLAIGLALMIITGMPEAVGSITFLEDPRNGLLERLESANITLALFNLIPAFPMDGGRVLRAMLASRMIYSRATSIAATVGKSVAILLAIAGIVYSPVLVFVAAFIYMSARAEGEFAKGGSQPPADRNAIDGDIASERPAGRG